MVKTRKAREHFSSRWGFIVACIGSAVGMGNLWRFPTMVSKWGGLTFLLPYLCCVLLISSTGVIAEFALGRATRSGPIGAFAHCAQLRWKRRLPGQLVGIVPILGAMALAIGYTVVMGWILKYSYLALSGGIYHMGQDMDKIGRTFTQTAEQNPSWIIVAALVAFVIMALGIARGIERANKLMMPALFLLMLALAIYIATLPGAGAAYTYIFQLRPQGLLDPQVWLFAFGQAFFSLSVAGNGSVIYGSYLSEGEDLPNSARKVALFDTVAALLAAFVILSAMAVQGAELSAGGPGLMFIYLVPVLNAIPGGLLVGMVFYVCVLVAGLSSIINLYEAPVATLQEQLGLGRAQATGLALTLGAVAAILIQGITSDWMDIVSIYICPLGALLAGLFFCWIAGKDFVERAVGSGRSKALGPWFYPLTKYVYCALCLLALIAGAIVGGIG